MKKSRILLSVFLICTLNDGAMGQSQQKANPLYLSILKREATYDYKEKEDLPAFTFQSSNRPELAALRQRLHLDSIAGFGNEISRLINLLHWVHNTIRHNGTEATGITSYNCNSILTAVKERGIGVSCGELATVLNECYLAMGWHSRKVFCFPKDSLKNDPDSHVINIVYSSSKKKWLWMDPTNDAYIMDENGELLGIEEVRSRLIANEPLLVNPDANWNHRISAIKEIYLREYMAKNLYELYSPLVSGYDYETKDSGKVITYLHLLPAGSALPSSQKYIKKASVRGATVVHYYTSNPSVFWAKPGDED